jgi:uncharacterized membrane protein
MLVERVIYVRNKIYQKELSFINLFPFFILGSLFGAVFEGIILLIQEGNFLVRSDLLYGPFSSLYGFGTIIFLILLIPKNNKRGIIKTFLYSFFIGGILEYIAGLISEILFHIKFWDYSKMFLNINGRTTIPIMLIWGIMGSILVKIIYPLISKIAKKIPQNIGLFFFILIFIFMIWNMTISYTAFFRMVLRNKGYAPKTIIGTIYDHLYNDDVMYQKFPILKGKF